MNRTIEEVSQELLRCAEALSDAVGQRKLSTVETLLARRHELLDEIRLIDPPRDAGTMWDAVARVREHDRRTGEQLRAIQGEIAEELGRVRSARRSASDASDRVQPSRFVSTRC